jgi:hypothetical protein
MTRWVETHPNNVRSTTPAVNSQGNETGRVGEPDTMKAWEDADISTHSELGANIAEYRIEERARRDRWTERRVVPSKPTLRTAPWCEFEE